MTQPRKRKQGPKLHKIDVSPRREWRRILKDIDKEDIPVDLLLSIRVKLIDGSNISIDIKQMLDAGYSSRDLEVMLDNKFNELESYIEDIDYFVSIDDVVSTVQPITDQILKKL